MYSSMYIHFSYCVLSSVYTFLSDLLPTDFMFVLEQALNIILTMRLKTWVYFKI